MLGFVGSHQLAFPSSHIILHSCQQWVSTYGFLSSPVFGVVSVLEFGHYSGCVVISPCFNLHFPLDGWVKCSFYLLDCINKSVILYVFFGEVFFGSVVKWVVFLLLNCKSSLYILDTVFCFWKIFPLACGLSFHFIFFFFLTVSLTEQNFWFISSLAYEFFHGLCPWYHIWKDFSKPKVTSVLTQRSVTVFCFALDYNRGQF